MSTGINTYVLKESTKAPCWVLRHNDVMVDFKDPKTKKVRKRKIRYSKGQHTFWDDELDSSVKTTSVEFLDGKFTAQISDDVLNNYLQIHPHFNDRFKLFDPEADAVRELDIVESIDEAKSVLRKLTPDMQKAMAVTLFGDQATRSWKEGTVKLQLHQYIDDKENEAKNGMSKANYFVEVSEDPFTQMLFFTTQGIRENKIEISSDKTAVRWTDGKGVICPVPSGKDPLRILAEFLLEKEGRPTFEELKKKLD